MVLAAAAELVAEQGAGALTMRKIAARLEVAPNALYSHVESKTALVDALLDDVLGLVQDPSPDAPDPVDAVARLMTSTYDVLVAHADLVPLYLARQGARGRHAIRLGETMTVLLERAGVTGTEAGEALRVLIVHAIGFAAFATRGPLDPTLADGPRAARSRSDFTASLHWLLTGITAGR